MGGYGSTRWNGIPIKYTTTECHRFDIRSLPFAEYMEAAEPHGRQYTWTQRGEPSGDIGIYFHPSKSLMTFVYAATDSQGNRQSFEEKIRVSKSPLHYGGYQYFIHCPSCQRRGRVLYKTPKGNRFLCRDCYKLTYVSAQEAHKDDRGQLRTLKFTLDLYMRFEKVQAKLKGKHYGSKAYKRLMRKLDKIFAQFEVVKNLPTLPPPKITIQGKRAFIRKRG